MQRPLVSIITPTLNQGAFIELTIRSVMAQSYGEIEHIVVDGGSNDETLNILRAYATSYPLRWISESDHGMYEAINKGLSLARGEILAYLNSDDLYFPWTVERIVQSFLYRPEADIVFGDGLSIDESCGAQYLSFVPPVDFASLVMVGSLVQPAVFMRRRVYERFGGFDQDLRYVGDLEYWLRVAADCSFTRIDEVLALERLHVGSLSSAYHEEMSAEDSQVRRRYGSQRDKQVKLLRLRAKVRAAYWRRLLWLRFLHASRSAGAGDLAWHHFLSQADPVISSGRAALTQLPRFGMRYRADAVISRRPWLKAPGWVGPETPVSHVVGEAPSESVKHPMEAPTTEASTDDE